MKNIAITENHLFQKAYASQKSARGKYVYVYVLRDKAAGKITKADPLSRFHNRLGLTVGKKIGGAVERVRARRLLRESYRLIEKEEGDRLGHGYLIVLAASGRINGAKMPEVREDIEKSFVRLGILRPAPAEPQNGKE